MGVMMVLAAMVEAVAPWSLLVLVIAMAMCLVRLIAGPTTADRVVALDLLTVLAAGAMAALALGHGEPAYVSVALVISLVAFLATVVLALYVNRRAVEAESAEAEEGEDGDDGG